MLTLVKNNKKLLIWITGIILLPLILQAFTIVNKLLLTYGRIAGTIIRNIIEKGY